MYCKTTVVNRRKNDDGNVIGKMEKKGLNIFKEALKSATCVALGAFALFMAVSCEKAVTAKDVVYQTKDKTILAYFIDNNNIASYAVNSINQIINGYLPDNGYVLIYTDNINTSTMTVRDTMPLLINVYKNSAGAVVTDTVYRFPGQNSATKAALKSAIHVAKTMFPATEMGLVLWSHGTGWLPAGYYASGTFSSGVITAELQERAEEMTALRTLKKLSGENKVKPFVNTWSSPPGGIDPYANMVKSFGLDNKTEMSIIDLAAAIPCKLDFIAFDACLMGGIEVAYQLKDSTNYVIFSPAEVLTSSFPYNTIMKPLFGGDYAAAAKAYNDYYAAQSGDSQSSTIAVVKTSALAEVAAQAKLIFDANRDKIQALDLSGIQPYFRYDKHWFYDINDFIVNLVGVNAASAFTAALNNAVVAKYTTGKILNLTIDPAKFSGVSTYINNPANSTLDAFYQNFAWEKAANMTAAGN